MKLAGIILAAGMGTRMGTDLCRAKQLLPLGGRAVLAHVVENALAAGLDPIILVLGHQAQEIMAAMDVSQVRVVVNPLYRTGMAGSVRAGLGAVPSFCDGAMFLLGDQPLVDKAVLLKLIKAFTGSNIVIPAFEGRQGNPVIFGAGFFSQLQQLKGDRGGRVLFDAYPDHIRQVPVETDSVCFDLDTPEDYERLGQQGESVDGN
ncbi:MAG: nucleotidyltransferase family protein [Proteobacteria bacterium]|nr:nucleotidyltransferase family protein [Desulfobacula sp.]MBU3951757.1 nucleotidyltransferase family protein [Pseudomonadota bacterium]MBU4132885.1 nucleotidyltransferase family protein [Pseudomonadota bacterium]